MRPEANCQICGTLARVIKHITFSYWFCDKCKDECGVFLKVISSSKYEKAHYHVKQDNDIVISKPGIYRLTYLDGTHEFYDHRFKPGDVRLDGASIRSATRLDDSDVPSRKQLQSLSETCKGTEPKGQSVRTLSDAQDCLPGIKKDQRSFGEIQESLYKAFIDKTNKEIQKRIGFDFSGTTTGRFKSESEAIQQIPKSCHPGFKGFQPQSHNDSDWRAIRDNRTTTFLKAYENVEIWNEFITGCGKAFSGIVLNYITDTYYGHTRCGSVYSITREEMQTLLEESNKCLQHGQVPPNDSI